MTTPDAVRTVALALPRAYEAEVRGRAKFRVKQIVFAALSRDETTMGFGYPKVERDGLVASDPGTFFLPPASDLRYQWVCAHLRRLADDEARELVTDAWRMCVPQMRHELPDLPAPAARAWHLAEQQDWGELRALLHPYLHFDDGEVSLRGPEQRAAPPRRPSDAAAAVRGGGARWAGLPLAAVRIRGRRSRRQRPRCRDPRTARSTHTDRWSEEGNGKVPVRRESGSAATGQNTPESFTRRPFRDGST